MRVLQAWKDFESILDPKAGPIQHAEMRMAFISGMWAALGLLDPANNPLQLHEQCRRLYEELEVAMEEEQSRCEVRRAKYDKAADIG
jgi:hypothetical protein